MLNVWEVAFAGMVTVEAGTTAALELAMVTVAPPLGDGPDSPTVTLTLWPPTTEVGETDTEETVTVAGACMETTPPVAAMASKYPVDNAPMTCEGVSVT